MKVKAVKVGQRVVVKPYDGDNGAQGRITKVDTKQGTKAYPYLVVKLDNGTVVEGLGMDDLVDPGDKKMLLFMQGFDIVEGFCKLNNIKAPACYITNSCKCESDMNPNKLSGWYEVGKYKDRTCQYPAMIHVDMKQCASPNPQYSWPAFKTDRTPLGVICHELGHHVYRLRGKKYIKKMAEVVTNEAAVSGYEPTVEEAFCEAFRVFVLNPDLLRKARPERFALLFEGFGLEPVETRTWLKVLQFHQAPVKVINRATTFLRSK